MYVIVLVMPEVGSSGLGRGLVILTCTNCRIAAMTARNESANVPNSGIANTVSICARSRPKSQLTLVFTWSVSFTGSMSWQFSGSSCGSWLYSGRLQAPVTGTWKLFACASGVMSSAPSRVWKRLRCHLLGGQGRRCRTPG